MPVEHLKPKTLAGIRSLAKDLKKIHRIKHESALELAAKQAGFSDYKHALRILSAQPDSFQVKLGHISCYWSDDRRLTSGLLTLSFPLSQLIGDLVSLDGDDVADAYLRAYKLEAPDHLERRMDSTSHSEAVELVHCAAYALQLMDRTGLKSANRDLPGDVVEVFKTLENGDHMSWWSSPTSASNWVVLDEPYNYRHRLAWAVKHGFGAAECVGQGLYRGGGMRTTIFAASEERANEISQVFRDIHNGKPALIAKDAHYRASFTSPYRKAMGERRKPRVMPHPEGTVVDGCIAYGRTPGQASEWRPDFTLPLTEHLKIGPVLAAMLPPFERDYDDPLIPVKNDLFTWFFREYADVMTQEIEDAYDGYGDGALGVEQIKILSTPGGQIAAIDRIISVLSNGYPSCRAVDIQLRKLRQGRDRILSS